MKSMRDVRLHLVLFCLLLGLSASVLTWLHIAAGVDAVLLMRLGFAIVLGMTIVFAVLVDSMTPRTPLPWGWIARGALLLGRACIFGLLGTLVTVSCYRIVSAALWNPKGELSDEKFFAYPCELDELSSVAGPKNISASSRLLTCGEGPFAGMDYDYVVVALVSKVGGVETRLPVFRYQPADNGEGTWPSLKWVDKRTLRIELPGKNIDQISKKVDRIGDVNINYVLGPTLRPNMSFWDRL